MLCKLNVIWNWNFKDILWESLNSVKCKNILFMHPEQIWSTCLQLAGFLWLEWNWADARHLVEHSFKTWSTGAIEFWACLHGLASGNYPCLHIKLEKTVLAMISKGNRIHKLLHLSIELSLITRRKKICKKRK